eukprot:Gb_23487 [translate_table: standard]
MESVLGKLNGFSSLVSAAVPQGSLLQRIGSVQSPRIAMLNRSSVLSRCYFRRPHSIRLYGLFHSVTSIKQEAIYRRDEEQLITFSTSKPVNSDTSAPDPVPLNPKDYFEMSVNRWDAFYRFSRPHTVIGTVIGIISVSLLAVQSLSDLSPVFFIGLLKAVIPALFMNIYIVGLNQIFDIEIDKVNKPYLPLASGEYSIATGVAIVTAFAFMSLSMGLMTGSIPLLWALSISLVLGTTYSVELPFLRWKRSAMAAAICILCVRAIVVQLAFYLHMQSSIYRRPAVLTKPLIFATAFMCFFSIVIALFKDIPDVDGDRIYGIQSFSVRLGQKRVFWLCIYLLQGAYCVAMVMGATSSFMWSKLVMVLGHAVLATLLWRRAQSLDLKSKVAITSFYMFIWKLFYAEYLLIPFVR